MVLYGSINMGTVKGRERNAAGYTVAGVLSLASVALVGIVLLSARSATVLEAKVGNGFNIAKTFSGDSVKVPATFVNYDQGTNFSPHGEFENSAIDKSVRLQELSNGNAKQSLHYVSGQAGAAGVSAIFDGIADSEHGANNHHLHKVAKHTPKDKSMKQSLKMTAKVQKLSNGDAKDDREQAVPVVKYIGGVPGDEVVDAFERPVGDVKHLNCNGRDVDPECQTSVMPLFDKSHKMELSTKKADADLDEYFAQQQEQATKARKPIVPKMFGSEKLVDAKGTKFGLSDEAALEQANAIFGTVAHKAGKTQQLRDNHGLNHFTKSKIPAHLDDFSTRSANADVLNFFDQMSTRDSHGNLLPNPQFKVAKAQQLAKKHLHHGYSTQMADTDLNHFFQSMHAENNHHLKDTHHDITSDRHTAFLAGHQAAPVQKKEHFFQSRKSQTQMLRSNRDDAFLGDASPVTKRGTLVKFAGPSATDDMSSFYDGLKKSRYGASNGHLKDTTPQPNKARGEHHGIPTTAAQHDINSYFTSLPTDRVRAPKRAGAAAMNTDAAKHDIDGYFAAMTPKVQHAAAGRPLDAKLDGESASKDIAGYFAAKAPKVAHADARLDAKLDADAAGKDMDGFWAQLAKSQHGFNNGKLATKRASVPQDGLWTPDATSKESLKMTDKQSSLATAPPAQPNKLPEYEHVGDISTSVHLDDPLFQGFKRKVGTAAADAAEVGDKIVDADTADCSGNNKDCSSSRSPLLYKGTPEEGSLKSSGSAMSAAKKSSSTAPAAHTKAIKQQKLSEYGVGPEEDHVIVVNQAKGVDAMMPESVFESNTAASDEQMKEVNEAIQAQRNEGYTNGEGMPAEDIKTP